MLKRKFLNRTALNIAVLAIFLVGVTLYFFKSEIGSLIWQIRRQSPVEWNHVRISFPKGMIYSTVDEEMLLFHWERREGILYLMKINLEEESKDDMIQYFKNRNVKELEDSELIFKGFSAFAISYYDPKYNFYNRWIYIVPKNMAIRYEGTKISYDREFNSIINNIQFLQ
jgi:hypothetical protein